MILDQLSNVNWLAIFVVFISIFMLGYVWYQLLFVKAYKIALGKENEELPKKAIYVVGPMVCCIMYTVTSAVLLWILQILAMRYNLRLWQE